MHFGVESAKKRTKKLLFVAPRFRSPLGASVSPETNKSFLVLFFKKELFFFLWMAGPARGPGKPLLHGFGLAGACAAGAALLWFALAGLHRISTRNAVLEKTGALIDQHGIALARRRAQLARKDPYGKLQTEKWQREIDYFIANHIEPALTADERASLLRNRHEVADLIERQVAAAARDQPPHAAFTDDMTPADFELFCAETLCEAGWDARVTPQGRDQGVDVIAEKPGLRVVLQCKLHARPVGNKSVQEAAAARAHEQANHAAVVTNNSYTQAAEQLAASNGVLLLHFRDLPRLDTILSRDGAAVMK
jgi:restriction system protein